MNDIKSKILELLSLCIEVSEEGQYFAFFRYSPHVHWISVYIQSSTPEKDGTIDDFLLDMRADVRDSTQIETMRLAIYNFSKASNNG